MLRTLSQLDGSGGGIAGTGCAIGNRDNDMVSTISPKGDGKRRITDKESHLRHQTERTAVRKEGGHGVTGVHCVASPN